MTMLPFIKAHSFGRGRHVPTRLIVIHTTETGTGPKAPTNIAKYFARKSVGVSAHVVCGENEIVQCVKVGDMAWAAPGANNDGIHMELVGKAAFTDEWDAAGNRTMLMWAACQAAMFVGLLRFLGVPFEVRRLSPDEIRNGVAGFCGHNDVTAAYGNKGGHSDPGQAFPWADFLGTVNWWIAHFDANGWPEANFR